MVGECHRVRKTEEEGQGKERNEKIGVKKAGRIHGVKNGM
jgi:hypothetical protein